MSILKTTIQDAMGRLEQIQDEEDRELFEREIWLHIISILSYQHGIWHNEAKGKTKHFSNTNLLPLLNPAFPFYSGFKQLYMAMYSPKVVKEERVEIYEMEAASV